MGVRISGTQRGIILGADAQNPLTLISWAHAYWAEGPEFRALGLVNGANVTTWPDEIGTDDLIYKAAGYEAVYLTASSIGGKPGVRPDSTSNLHVVFATIAQPWTIVMIMNRSPGGFEYSIDGGTYESAIVYQTATVLAGAALAGAAAGTFLWSWYGNGASSVVQQNGATVASGDSGSSSLTGFTLFAGAGATANGVPDADHGCFYGIIAGDVRAQPGWANFKLWAAAHYGLAVV